MREYEFTALQHRYGYWCLHPPFQLLADSSWLFIYPSRPRCWWLGLCGFLDLFLFVSIPISVFHHWFRPSLYPRRLQNDTRWSRCLTALRFSLLTVTRILFLNTVFIVSYRRNILWWLLMRLKQVVAKRSHAPASSITCVTLNNSSHGSWRASHSYLSQGNNNSVSKNSNNLSGSFYNSMSRHVKRS